MALDTLFYDNNYINAVKNINFPAYGNQLLENKAGTFRDLQTEFLIKFTNFNLLNSLPDTLVPEIISADMLLYASAYHGSESSFSLDLYFVDPDTALIWDNNSKIGEVETRIDGRTSYYGNFQFSTAADSLLIPVDRENVLDWYQRPDLAYQNNGFLIRKSNDDEGLIAFYSQDYTLSAKRPKLRLQCSLRDSNAVFVKDTTFYIPAAGDLQFTESLSVLPDSLFYLSQGNIFRSYIMLDSLRADTLLGKDRLLNKAEQTFVMHPFETDIAAGDTLFLTARLFRTDHWESDSIAYTYTAYSNTFSSPEDTIRIDISQLLQYLVANPPDKNYEGIFFFLNNEYNAFNKITIHRPLSRLEIIYTKVVNE
ncbi:MAG: hypothetical protein PHX07_02430 [Candidatus Marinimicrobia bacterium]|nr:hypothetical protein [Candidatus Neomarinimicrobiota bacterium]MDD4961072.1 hypothetical protein [Candidatus Neomarinimicrobiota bacterium]MDD5709510.1 hypothetical protein [Candidatus Neomarinimicrobiota bacterium]